MSEGNDKAVEPPSRIPPLPPEMHTRIIEALHAEVNELVTASWGTGQLGGLTFRRSEAADALFLALRQVNRMYRALSLPLRNDRVTLENTEELVSLFEQMTHSPPRRLDLTCTRNQATPELVSVLEAVPDLRHLSLRYQTVRRGDGTYMVRTSEMRPGVFEGILHLHKLEVLILGNGATSLFVNDFHKLAEACPGLKVLHIPRIIAKQLGTPSAQEHSPTVAFTHLETFSVGSSDAMWVQRLDPVLDQLRFDSFPQLRRLNLLGAFKGGRPFFPELLKTVVILETSTSDDAMWAEMRRLHEQDDDAPAVEQLVLHVAQQQSSFHGVFPHVKRIHVVDDISTSRPGSWSDKLGDVLRAAMRLHCPTLSHLQISVGKESMLREGAVVEAEEYCTHRRIELTTDVMPHAR